MERRRTGTKRGEERCKEGMRGKGQIRGKRIREKISSGKEDSGRERRDERKGVKKG